MTDYAQYELSHNPLVSGYNVSFVTADGGLHPPHWHEELEILYHLNGDSDITIENQRYKLRKRHMFVIDSQQVHSTYTRDKTAMFVCIHISKSYMEKYVPELHQYQISCIPDRDINVSNFRDYYQICRMLQWLTVSYIQNDVTVPMETEGLVLLILTRVIQMFAKVDPPIISHRDALKDERIRDTIDYVAAHFQEPVDVKDVASTLGLSEEYFCRFFKKHMGITYLTYVNTIRIAHAYRDLKETDLPISMVMENNGFTNQKLFNRFFKSVYGKTPREVRKN